jgi:hypothetical protein
MLDTRGLQLERGNGRTAAWNLARPALGRHLHDHRR